MESIYLLLIIASLVIGISSSLIGSFVVLQKKSLLGDVVSHAILPGILLAFLLSSSRHQWSVFTGALIAGWLAIAHFETILKQTKLKSDAALAIVLSTYFSLGLVIYSIMQSSNSINSAGLSTFIYGQLIGVNSTDLITFSILLILLFVFFFFRYRFVVANAFQEEYMKVKGFKTNRHQLIFDSLLVLIIAMGVQAVGVILMSALLIVPFVSARFFGFNIKKTLLIAVSISVISTTFGCLISFNLDQMPTGPWIIIFLSLSFFVSFLLKSVLKK